MLNKLKLILLVIFVFLIFISCAISEEIIVTLPEEANWQFEYFDSLGAVLGDGKAEVKFYENTEDIINFSLKITESVFGDIATITGYIEVVENENNMLPFKGIGKWFLGEEFYFEGDFNTTLTKIYDGSIAYSKDIKTNISKLLEDYKAYRMEKWKYDCLSDSEKMNTQEPIRPAAKGFMDKIYSWNAYLLE